MNSTKTTLLSAMVSASFYRDKNPTVAKFFDAFVQSILDEPLFKSQTEALREQNFIDQNGITPKGYASLIHSPKMVSRRQLSINTKAHLLESLEQNQLAETLNYISDQQFTQLAEVVLANLGQRLEQGMKLTGGLAEVFGQAEIITDDHDLVIQEDEEVILNNEVVAVESVKKKPAKQTKAKAKV